MTEKQNILIAEFIGLEKMECNTLKTTYYKMYEEIDNPASLSKWYEPHQLEFHKNLEWLQPVLNKIIQSNPNNSELEKYMMIEDKKLLFDFCVESISNN